LLLLLGMFFGASLWLYAAYAAIGMLGISRLLAEIWSRSPQAIRHRGPLEAEIGTIEAGKVADLAVWDTNFYSAPTATIKDARCEMTLFNGEVVYRAE
jgi:hypothetical protein